MNVQHQPNSGEFDLIALAHGDKIEDGFEPDFPPEAERDVTQLKAHSPKAGKDAEDLRHRLSSSIENDTSRDRVLSCNI